MRPLALSPLLVLLSLASACSRKAPEPDSVPTTAPLSADSAGDASVASEVGAATTSTARPTRFAPPPGMHGPDRRQRHAPLPVPSVGN